MVSGKFFAFTYHLPFTIYHLYEFTQKIINRLRRVGIAFSGDGGGNIVDDFELDEDFQGDGKSLSAQSAFAAHPRFDVSRF